MVTDADPPRAIKAPALALLPLEQARLWVMTGMAAFLLGGAFVFRSEWTLWKGLFWIHPGCRVLVAGLATY